MNTTPDLDRVFPLSTNSTEYPALHAPDLATLVRPAHSLVMGNRAFLRSWAARRAAARLKAQAAARTVDAGMELCDAGFRVSNR
jgi:hypothetical protein